MKGILSEHPFLLSGPSLTLLIENICEGQNSISRDSFTLRMREFMGDQQAVND